MAQMLTIEVALVLYTVIDVPEMEILILSQEDSRLPIVDLARTLGDMTKQETLFAQEISTDLIHEHLTGTSPPCLTHNPERALGLTFPESLMTEPDLLILFSPRVNLQGFPPWQIRLTEILFGPPLDVRC